ncbi:MAG: hypothetical protein Fues2KO_23980 [Fuerstiella sp.]
MKAVVRKPNGGFFRAHVHVNNTSAHGLRGESIDRMQLSETMTASEETPSDDAGKERRKLVVLFAYILGAVTGGVNVLLAWIFILPDLSIFVLQHAPNVRAAAFWYRVLMLVRTASILAFAFLSGWFAARVADKWVTRPTNKPRKSEEAP